MSPDPWAGSQPTLTTERLVLRPFTPDDGDRVQALAGAREVALGTLTIPHPYPDGAAQEWIATHAPKWAAGTLAAFAIVLPEEGVIGAIGLEIVREHRRAELGYWMGVPWWGRGLATEAARGVIRFGFEVLELDRIHAGHYTRNPASGRVLEKAGMVREGVLRAHIVKWGKPEDVAVYAVLRAERP